MIHAYSCDNRDLAVFYYISGIKSSSHTDFKNYNITFFFRKIHECDCRNHFKYRRCCMSRCNHIVNRRLYSLGKPRKVLTRYFIFTYAYALGKSFYKRRSVQSRLISGMSQHTFRHCRYRPFSVCSCHMNIFQFILRISQKLHQFSNCSKSRSGQIIYRIFQKIHSFIIRHQLFPFTVNTSFALLSAFNSIYSIPA